MTDIKVCLYELVNLSLQLDNAKGQGDRQRTSLTGPVYKSTAVRVTEDRHRWHHVKLTAKPLGWRQ